MQFLYKCHYLTQISKEITRKANMKRTVGGGGTSACGAREIYSPVILKSGKSKLWLSLFVDWEHLPAKL
jgi:hypothetical protein